MYWFNRQRTALLASMKTAPSVEPYLTFQSVNSFTISVASPKWDGTMEYSTDTENWTTWNGSSISSVDGKVYLRGTGNTRVSSSSGGSYSQFVISGTAVECVGNIETLLDWQAVVDGQHPTMDSYCFYSVFRDCSALIKAPELPTENLADECYSNMFRGCISLTTAPDLPATIMKYGCYRSMFNGCTALTTAPDLPANNLDRECYIYMFKDCTSLTTAPALPATNLAFFCYSYMFYGCTSLTTVPALPATTLANYCYHEMFHGCTNLTTAPALPATTLADYCYNFMFYGCTSLTTVPALPATTLANYCYANMFQGCTNLKVSETQDGIYQYEWRIPTEGTISSAPSLWNFTMLTNTGGTFTGAPTINTTYYVENQPVSS
jgi:hypothetical protein